MIHAICLVWFTASGDLPGGDDDEELERRLLPEPWTAPGPVTSER